MKAMLKLNTLCNFVFYMYKHANVRLQVFGDSVMLGDMKLAETSDKAMEEQIAL